MSLFDKLWQNTREKGEHYEKLAEQYLQQQGLTPVARNFHCKYGEIDLIMQHEQQLVFVEVKYRKSEQFGGAIHALSATKQQRLRRSVAYYLASKHLNNQAVRIDFIAIQGDNNPQIKWIQNIL